MSPAGSKAAKSKGGTSKTDTSKAGTSKTAGTTAAETKAPKEGTKDALARAFLATLAHTERKKREWSASYGLELPDDGDAVEELVAAAEGGRKPEFVPIRADLAAVAILVARAIEAEPGLITRLRREAPVLTIATHVGELVEIAGEVVRLCAFAAGTIVQELTNDSAKSTRVGRAVTMLRDGANKFHAQDVGNNLVAAVLHSRIPIVGISPDPVRELPRDLNRAADCRLSLPPFDFGVLALVVEAVVGAAPTRRLDDEIVRSLDVGDLPVALRRASDPDGALDELARVAAERADYLHSGPSLRDLHGYGDAKTWGMALELDLKLYKNKTLAWDALDSRAVLVTGPPGVGKTSFARAVAKECRVPLVATSVAEWNAAEYLSGTLKRIREVFSSARSRAPCILFIDELDGLSDRAQLRGEYVQYWAQIVNCFLELLSGIEALEGVVVIAATNHPDSIDAAVKRSGRLDRTIEIRKPDTATLCAIFRQYVADDVPADADLLPLALAARGRTGADIEAWVRRARGCARRAGRKVAVEDILAEIREGRPPLPAEFRRRIALHEGGHIVVHLELAVGSVVDVGLHDDGGEAVMLADLAGDATPAEVETLLTVILAGRVAEQIGLGSPSIGGASDLRKATGLARDLELRFGMGVLGPVQLDPVAGELLTSHGLLEAVAARLRAAETRARELLDRHWILVEAVARNLENAGHLAGNEILAILERTRLSGQHSSGSAGPDPIRPTDEGGTSGPPRPGAAS